MPDYAMTQGTLPLLALRSVLLLPGASAPLELGRATASSIAIKRASERPRSDPTANLLIVAVQRDGGALGSSAESLYPIGVLAEIVQVRHGVPGRFTSVLRGIARVNILDVGDARDHQTCRFDRSHEPLGDPTLAYALAGALQDLLKQHDALLPSSAKTKARAQELAKIAALRAPGEIADRCASHVELEDEERREVLLEVAVSERLRKVIELVSRAANTLQVKRDLDRAVREHLSKHEHDALLRHKLRAIQSELGETQGEMEERWFRDIERRLDEAELPPEARAAADRELGRLRRMNRQSSEAATTRNYLDWLASLPWSAATESPDELDIAAARRLLDEQHYGLKRVKKRVLEYLSVRKLAPDKRGPILCLAGPPGVGKTSLGRSIAEALGRKLVRISLGGVRDDAEIRGHRRTYVGALPGRLIQAMKRAGTRNPVIVLDEIDKLGGPNLRGDPASALLEALDPEQNDAFSDHYLGLDYDLSRVIFIATANDLSGIPAVLRDRLEIIELPGYTVEEKVAIARRHLLPKQRHEHGLENLGIELSDALLLELATAYTRESGVRNLEREIASLLRDVAMHIAEGKPPPSEVKHADLVEILGPPRFHDELAAKQPAPGVVTGLGWTPVGGTLLFVEVTITRGKGNLRRTGKLGSVMKESAQAALSYVRSRAERLGIDDDFMASHDVHVHFPAGAVPKDGPSAGIAVATAIVSALLERPARVDVAMTGELTLRGHVLPIGGVREKVLAAHRAGIREVILPERNRKDEPELPEQVREDMTLHFVRSVDQVLELMLLPADDKAAAE
ncbi:MAG: endopeptidase La [Myxococcales bacterium]|nr:endopeptidase La [Myxococcales bacterium]